MLTHLLVLLRRLEERVQEYRFNIRTAEWHSVIDPANPERRGYSPTSYADWRIISRLLRPVDPASTFIDYGAGLGRVTILATRLGFKQVIGIDFSEDLVAKARDNLRAARSHLRSPAIIIMADAASFEPPEDTSVIFFHNPFAGSILMGALQKIKTSYDACPRPLRLICNLPFESAFEDEIRRQARLTLVGKHELHEQRKCLIFSLCDT
jgi:SAM-dependent methyltransferase